MNTSRLRRIFLINGKTSGVLSSAMITELNPCGGAAITGENGVGKTTSLQLIPLFFGASPSRIITPGSTVMPMLEFMLPHETSAIAYEYQRGNTDDDLRLVVIRRNNATDAAEYRLFRSGFREELFIRGIAQDDGEFEFLNDDASNRVAASMHIIAEGKLSTAEYRHVILHQKAQTREAAKLRKLAESYSYANCQLANLDKIMSAMVKEKIDFKDLLAVVVSIIHERVGTSEKLALKGMKTQMDRWVADRKACAEAFKHRETILDIRRLSEEQKKHRDALMRMRSDVEALGEHLRLKAEQTEQEIKALKEAHDNREEQDKKALSELSAKIDHRCSIMAQRETAHRALKADEQAFQMEDIEAWSHRFEGLDNLRTRLDQTKGKIQILRSTANNIAQKIDEEIGRQKQVVAQKLQELEESKSVPGSEYDASMDKLHEQQNLEAQSLEEILSDQKVKLSNELMQLQVKQASINALITSVVDAPKDRDELDRQEEKLGLLSAQLETLQAELEQAKSVERSAKAGFEAAEITRSAARKSLEQAQERLKAARNSQSPKPGTLRSALHAGADENWTNDLAKVINPSLLDREDLKPGYLDEQQNASLYGWSLNLERVDVPSWANKSLMEQEIAEHERQVALAREGLLAAESALSSCSVDLKAASVHLAETQSACSISSQNRKSQQEAVKQLKTIMAHKRERARQESVEELKKIDESIARHQEKQKELQRQHSQERQKAATANAQAREKLQSIREQAIAAIDRVKAGIRQSMGDAVKDLMGQRNRMLTEAGVDTHKLREAEELSGNLEAEILELSSREWRIKTWRTWRIDSPAKMERLEAEIRDLKQTTEELAESRLRMISDMEEAASQYRKKHRALGEQKDRCDSGLKTLTGLLQGKLAPFFSLRKLDSAISADKSVAELVGEADKNLNDYDVRGAQITSKVTQVQNKLMGTGNAVSALVNGYITEEMRGNEHDNMLKADVLCDIYDRIPREIVAPLNTELGTILETLDAFKLRIKTYERAASEFNAELQQGIAAVVSTFNRLRAFEIHLVSTFGEESFIKRLDDLSDVVRDYRMKAYMTSNVELPSDETAQKIRMILSEIDEGDIDIDLTRFISIRGSADDNGITKKFKNEEDLKKLSSTGITAIAMITLITGMLNIVRGNRMIYIPWATDEVGRFDGSNFSLLMNMLAMNRIDVVTASPYLTASAYSHFQHRYLFLPQSEWAYFEDDPELLEDVNRTVLLREKNSSDEAVVITEEDGYDRAQ